MARAEQVSARSMGLDFLDLSRDRIPGARVHPTIGKLGGIVAGAGEVKELSRPEEGGVDRKDLGVVFLKHAAVWGLPVMALLVFNFVVLDQRSILRLGFFSSRAESTQSSCYVGPAPSSPSLLDDFPPGPLASR